MIIYFSSCSELNEMATSSANTLILSSAIFYFKMGSEFKAMSKYELKNLGDIELPWKTPIFLLNDSFLN